MVRLEQKYLERLRQIVAENVDTRQWRPVIFDSRITGKAQRFSDIDLGFIGTKPLPLDVESKHWDVLDDSDVPYVVDIVDFSQTEKGFRKVAEKKHGKTLMTEKLERQRQQIIKAKLFLDRMLAKPEDEMQRAASIQAFGFCFEPFLKYLKSMVEQDGSVVASPKAVFREAAHHGRIDNPERWFAFLRPRNPTSHTYVEVITARVYEVIKQDLAAALSNLVKLEDNGTV